VTDAEIRAQLCAVALLDLIEGGRRAVEPAKCQRAASARVDIDQTCIERGKGNELRRTRDARVVGLGAADRRDRAGSSDRDEYLVSREHDDPGLLTKAEG